MCGITRRLKQHGGSTQGCNYAATCFDMLVICRRKRYTGERYAREGLIEEEVVYRTKMYSGGRCVQEKEKSKHKLLAVLSLSKQVFFRFIPQADILCSA